MKATKKTFALLLFSLVLVFISACNNESASNTEIDSDKPYSISIMANLHTPEVPQDKIKDLLEEKTNTKLEFQWVPDNNYEERLNTAFATGSLPQAVFMKNQTTFNQFKDAIRDDQFWEIGPYLDEYENLSKLKDQIIENTMVDDKIYSLYQGRPLSRQGIIYRKDWADNLGLSAPTTTEEFFEMAKQFTENDPNKSGKKDTIGVTDRSDLVYGAFYTVASWFGTPNEWGEGEDGKLKPAFMFPEYMQTLDYFKDLHENGYMNQDFPVTSKNDQQALFINGTAGIYVGSMGDVQSLYTDLAKVHPDAELAVHNYVEGPHGEYGIWSLPGYGNVVMFPKSSVKTEAELKRILAFFNDLMSPEVSNLIFWGIEGEHYSVVDGMGQPAEDTAKNDREVKPFQAIEIGEPETNGRYEGYHTYEPKAKSEELFVENEKYLIADPTLTLDSDAFLANGERLRTIIQDATYQYILRQIDKDGFEKAVQRWLDQGGQTIIDEFNESAGN
ncbi:extracellular solute-binding protein [Sutcliffiella horikoshii]|uniref:extracellular solute-binding protein n=1 Tax=Sutcliffiella horikoshii TaxID=79883 RepID=UPI001F3F5B73|nr:extracellular solute-binding protein [Sutcliffiella horikoshii]MCG1021854.1 extracellular solute-binding protein [Sutcliffiella horikoshii]